MSRFAVGNPWLTIWIKPRQTIREIISLNPSFRLFGLSVIYGLPMMFYFAQGASMAQNFSVPVIIFFALILSALIGFIGINIGSILLFWTGKLLGGVGSFKQVRAAVAWSNATNVVNCCIWFVLIGVFGSEVFLADFPLVPLSDANLYLLNVIFIIQVIVAIWSLFIFLHSLGEAQGFSAWKALVNTLLPMMFIFIGLWVLGFVMSYLGSGVRA